MDNDSDIYEDEFFPGADRGRDYRAPREHWPEDRFYYHRQQLRPRENFFQRGWHRLRDEWRGMNGQGPAYYGRYPEDHHHGSYGREFEAENANRGPWIHERFRW